MSGQKTQQKGELPKLDLNVTNRCNYRCAHCAFDSGELAMREFPIEKIRQILEDTRKLGGQKFDITGGEPLVRPDIEDIIMIGKELGYKIELITNGSLLTPEIVGRFRQKGLDSMAISIDGSTYEVYSRIRLVDEQKYQKVIHAVDMVLGAGIPLKINTVAFEENYQDIPNITQWCIGKGVVEHGIYYFTPVGRGRRTGLKSVEPVKWLDFVRENLAALGKQLKISVEFPFVRPDMLEGLETRCIAESQQYHLQILPDGNVYPCAIMASYHMPIANLNECSVADIWKNKELWDKYWQDTQKVFQACDGCCADFKGSFDAHDYSGLKVVCPLRKYSPGDII